jgi:serpin B
MNKKIFIILAVIVLLGLVACSQLNAAELKSSKPRVKNPDVSQSTLDILIKDNNTFGLNLFKSIMDADKNTFYSPYSISTVMAMAYGGSAGNTEVQMSGALNFNLSQAQLHPAFSSLDEQLAKRGQGAKGMDGKDFRLKLANALWGQKDYSFTSYYLDLLAENYGAGIKIVDFSQNPEQSRQIINQWVSKQTENKIKEILSPDSVSPLTRLVLTNTIYFNAAWLSPFPKNQTHNGQFKLLDGSEISVPYMYQEADFKYFEGKSYQALELLYDGEDIAMDIFLPEPGQFNSFAASFNWGLAQDVIKNLESRKAFLLMPQFKIESQFNLNNTLGNMGMSDAFSSKADFSGMTGNKDLYINEVVHKAYILVNETGTEAAAAGAVVMTMSSAPPVVELDSPFIFIIRDIQTNTILFIGSLLNPGV